MPTQEVGGKFYVVKKDGSLGKRGFSSEENAEKAQARGKEMAGVVTSETSTSSTDDWDDPDTAEERKALGIPPRPDPAENAEGW